MNEVYLSLGTNMGEREENLRDAVRLLRKKEGLLLKKISPIYETLPVGYVNQATFLNIALYIHTNLSPFEMLDVCQSIENELGRVRDIRWGPRIIDLDILLYNNENVVTEKLTIPHERMFERAFVLVPLMDIAKKPYNEYLMKAQKTLGTMNLEKEGIKVYKEIIDFE